MYYLGLDPSTKCTGYCIMDIGYDIIDSGKISMPKTDDEGEKILTQVKEIERLLTQYPITRIMCEDQFSKLNVDTLKKLSRVTGAILYIAKKHNVPIETVFPTSWRKIFHGYGSAKKEDTFHKVQAIYDLHDLVFKKDSDLTDSIGIAFALVSKVKEEREVA